ncbi:SDR family NAD(P)-dependent oxidoreductase [Nocardioides kongjuensis]|uniref:NAD(P)-dependent dehydrogenase (Short-subunit alcohol dehydrogenase family) n=1 Tax=Nocardioides kongjuensis TaxID=349522 RepID=A0A852R7I7_9ACTN|nr:SDR family oxidoreductase [Nocardioides kongjuensis]NYD28887.1 NAD(P)-dependent dehydrogenase (short-subunit alcohol dehydrogenase family) [Nocardioides kongjuensis]
MTDLSTMTVLVTGATGGLGEAICRRLAADGAGVVVTDLDRDACAHLVAGLPAPERHLALAQDVSSETDWEAVVDAVRARFGRLDALVNNAGIGGMASVTDETLAGWDRIVRVDQTGVWLGMKHAGALVEEGGGSIVNISSILGIGGGLGNSAAYAAAKGAVTNLTKNAALHWAQRGVRVNSVHPGFIGTRQLLDRFEGSPRHAAMLANTPMGRLGRAEEVAAVVAFLVSDDSSYMTGSEVRVDGGWSAR